MAKKNVSIDITKWPTNLIKDLAISIFIGIALLLTYLPDWYYNDSLFSEMNSLARDQSDITKKLSGPNPDLTVLEIAKNFPLRITEKGKIYVKKGFSRCVNKMPNNSLLAVIITSIFLMIITFFIFRFSQMENHIFNKILQEKGYHRLWEVVLFIVILLSFLPPMFILFRQMKGSAMALAGFYAAVFTWFFSMKRNPYCVEFRVESEGPLDVEKCRMMAEHYSKLLSFILAVFTACTIGLGWYISQTLAETSGLFPKLLNYQLSFLFLHDIYLSAWLFLGVASNLIKNYVEIVSRLKQCKNYVN